ncbi:iron-sulfur cluster assembly scaffold protein [Desulforhopalus singaporensis]|uniref:Nitrogen fixation protein NifU n=1 Tax=Desulforhopalus singaporensis TaxID=91360 RepID=A0A1H0V390_9BACT|nr:iron-sulfur cluster assembly scaffold protein [Desulforhopalus singaporensis]SDP73009.1 nitrogen fixation protein NifU [Desulforhopalus singaporensis]
MADNSHPSYEEHSENFQKMVSRVERYGELEYPDGYGTRTGDCGDTIEIFLSVRGAQLQMVTFRVNGCANTVACGNTVSFLMEGRTLADGWELTPENVSDYLKTLPADHFHCAELAVGAFYNALTDYNKRQKEQWKQNYPRR